MLSMFKLLFISLASFPVLCSSMDMYEKCFFEVFDDEKGHLSNLTSFSRKDINGDEKVAYPTPRQGFRDELEVKINKQINKELFAHYTYLSMAYHFDRDDIKMTGFYNFFLKMAKEEHEHAQMLMKYQNKRGGRIVLREIKTPCYDGIWGNGTQAMRKALELEKLVNKALIDLHQSTENDPQFLDFLETNFLGEQVDSIKQLSDYLNILERLNSPLGEYQFDKMTLLKKFETESNL